MGTRVGWAGASAYQGEMDAPSHQSLGWHLWHVSVTPRLPLLGQQQPECAGETRPWLTPRLGEETPNINPSYW